MSDVKLITDADALSRAAYNGLLYCPKDPLWGMCMMISDPESVSIITTDGYSLAWARCPVRAPDGTPGGSIKLTRDALADLEGRTRKDKRAEIHLDFRPGRGLEYRGEDPEDDVLWPDVFEDSLLDEPDTLDEYLLDTFKDLIDERLRDRRTQRVIVAPKYLRKLGQLKKVNKDQGADFLFAGEEEEVLIQVGPEFRLVVQPIEPERHAAAIGEGATWSYTTPPPTAA